MGAGDVPVSPMPPAGRSPAGAPAPDPSSVPAALTVGAPAPPRPVGPPTGHVLDGVDRDAGIGVELSDDSVLWLFGDTAMPSPDGTLAWFVIGTAAWAPVGDPLVTADYVDASGRPVPLAVPGAGFPPCPAGTTPGCGRARPSRLRRGAVTW
jgi:hypothetical protein